MHLFVEKARAFFRQARGAFERSAADGVVSCPQAKVPGVWFQAPGPEEGLDHESTQHHPVPSERDGKYLMLHRVKKQGDENQDKWVGPGGKFEAGRAPRTVPSGKSGRKPASPCWTMSIGGIVTFVSDEWGTEYMHLFWSDRFEGGAQGLRRRVLEWVDKHQLLTKNIWEGDKIFLDLLEKRVPFFS